MTARLLVAFALLVAALGCATGEGARREEAPTGPLITKVTVEGNEAVSDGRILSRIATRASRRAIFFGTYNHLDRGAVAQDLRRIHDIYEEAGFYAAQADVNVVPDGKDQVRVIFLVHEGKPTLVRTLLVAGLDPLSKHDRAEVLDDAPLREGGRFVQSGYMGLKSQLKDRLLARGYAEAKVEGRAEVAPAEGTVDVVYEVDPGRIYEFGKVGVEGDLLVPSGKIRNAAKPVLEAGDRFSPDALREAQAEVFSLGAFSVATVTPGDPNPDKGTVPVNISVSEADFLRLRLGAGVGLEQSFYQARAIAEFTHLNLFGGLQRFSFRNELAYRFILEGGGIGTSRSGFAGSSAVQLTQPDLISNRIDLATRIAYVRDLTRSYTSQSVAGTIGTPIRFRRWLIFTPSYNIQHYFDVSIVGENTFIPTAPGVQPSLLFGCTPPCTLTLSYLEQILAADKRSNPLEPRAGWYAALGLQEGGGPLQGSFDWIRIAPDFRGYLPVSEDMVLALRLELGFLQPFGTTACQGEPQQLDLCSPIVVRFFGGGAAGFRGAGVYRLSPLLREETVVRKNGRDTIETSFVPIGGNSNLLATTELRWYFADALSSAFFLDVGDVKPGPAEVIASFDPLFAIGAGIRYRTPVGPARLDVGYRFLHQNIEPVIRGGTVEKNTLDYFAIFLSVGEAF